jgi:hypothetical protein
MTIDQLDFTLTVLKLAENGWRFDTSLSVLLCSASKEQVKIFECREYRNGNHDHYDRWIMIGFHKPTGVLTICEHSQGTEYHLADEQVDTSYYILDWINKETD